jgi:hypothetical protein
MGIGIILNSMHSGDVNSVKAELWQTCRNPIGSARVRSFGADAMIHDSSQMSVAKKVQYVMKGNSSEMMQL